MAEFKIDYKLIAPQTYDRGDVGEKSTKLSRDTQRGSVTVSADNFEEAKKKAKPIIKNSKTFENFSSRQSFDAPRKPSIKILKPVSRGGGGSGALKSIRSGSSLFAPTRKKLFKGGLIKKPKLAVKGY
jgi:hypothetical protein